MPWATPPQSRSIACNGEIIRHFRNDRGWTQDELANEAGYTKRLVAKAEAGGSLSPETIEILAEALSCERNQVFPECLTSSPKELATAFLKAYARYEEKMVSKCRHFLADDFCGVFPGGPDCAPLAGIYEGADAYDEFVHNFFRVFQRPNKKLAEETMVVTTSGNQAVVVAFEVLENEHISPGNPPGHFVLNLGVSKGKIKSVQHIFDSESFARVVTMWRENQTGVVDVSKNIHVPLPERNGDAGT